MCKSKAQGGKRCDYHQPVTSSVISQVTKTSFGATEEDVKSAWKDLREKGIGFPDPSRKEFTAFVKEQKFRVKGNPALLTAEKQSIIRKLDESLEDNSISGRGFYALTRLDKAVKTKVAARAEAAAAAKKKAAVAARPAAVSSSSFVSDASYDSWPLPQADNLDKVSTVVDAISGGATTPESIGESIDAVDRQGSYYANAAGYLGLVEKSKDDVGMTQFSLTMAGQTFQNLPTEDRAMMLKQLVEQTPLMQSFRSSGNSREELEKTIGQSGGHEASVSKRRAASIMAWNDSLANVESLSASMDTGRQQTISRSIEASQKQAVERANKQQALFASVVKQHGAICSQCFMAKSLNGTCDNCD